MPLYEYECEAGHRFELIRKFSDPPLDKCPECGSAVHKLMSSPAIQFKGTGWYITDYARKDSGSTGGGSKAEKAEKADKASDAAKTGTSDTAAAKGDSKSESKTEAKSESKAETKPAAKPAGGE